MGYRNESSVYFYEADHSINFSITNKKIVEGIMEAIENMAHEAIAEENYEQTLELLIIFIEGEKALEQFDKPKFEPTYPKTSTGLLEDE